VKVLFLVIARGGSKSVPRKNVRPLGGIPLVAFKIRSALKAAYCKRLILSTDDAEIQEIGRRYGADVPFTRPAELANDTASSDDVVLHAMDFVDASEGTGAYDAVMLLEAATPFATAADYDAAVELMVARNANLVVGMTEHKPNRAFVGTMTEDGGIGPIIRQIRELNRVDRQALGRNYTMNGAFYLMRWDHFRRVKRRYVEVQDSYGVVMESIRSVEIDEPVDMAWAEFLVSQKFINLDPWT
jgi:N-acylneuraminate cytidylyltransferase/CMP-N,N'-diacetyllegionaminic acid synthase